MVFKIMITCLNASPGICHRECGCLQGSPVSEALFNFVNAWSLMFWPLFVADKKRDRVENKLGWWLGVMVCFCQSHQNIPSAPH